MPVVCLLRACCVPASCLLRACLLRACCQPCKQRIHRAMAAPAAYHAFQFHPQFRGVKMVVEAVVAGVRKWHWKFVVWGIIGVAKCAMVSEWRGLWGDGWNIPREPSKLGRNPGVSCHGSVDCVYMRDVVHDRVFLPVRPARQVFHEARARDAQYNWAGSHDARTQADGLQPGMLGGHRRR